MKEDHEEMDQEQTVEEEKMQFTNNEWKREIDSKIIYQYPKGNFRFPVIPDEEQQERSVRKDRRSSAYQPRQEVVKKTDPSIQKKKETDIQNKKANQFKKPFKLTETPSPIYGYNRPVSLKQNEHESTVEKVTKTKDFLPSGMIKKELNEEPHLLFEEDAASIDDFINEKSTILPEKSEVLIKQHPMEEAIQCVTEEKKVDKIRSQANPVSKDVVEDAIKSESLQDNWVEESVLDSTIWEEEHMDLEELSVQSQLDLVPPVDYEQDERIGQTDSLFQVNDDDSAKSAEEEAVLVNVQSVEVETVEKQNIASKRNSLPFNVLMLNSDRQSLAQKKQLSDEYISNEKKETETIIVDTQINEEPNIPYYVFPEDHLLIPPFIQIEEDGWMEEQKELLNHTFANFNVHANVVNITQGPSVTRYEVQPDPGVKVSKITNLSDDLKLSLAAKDIRIEAPIPGKHTIGIEVPNRSSRPVFISEILTSKEFVESSSPLTVALGLDISGKPIVTDLRKMPHGLIAGATGSGKSVCINTMLVSLLYKAKPEELKLLLIDPKMVELAPYNYIPHLASPVITDVKAATAALKWAVEEMERRYELLAHAGVRDISKFNQLAEEHERYSDKLPYIVIVIDELADLMMMAPADVEEAISRIAQKARACGIHLLIATQRPSVDVITGLIKANVPTRIAFSVSSQIDSRTVLDISGAEKLLGKGDMLFLENGTSKPIRLQGTFVSDEEIDKVVAHVRRERMPEFLFEHEELLKKVQMTEEEDELFYEACEFIIEQGGASTSSLQRRFKIGYNRAARLIDMMEKQGFISEAKGTKPRDVLITEMDFVQIHENG